MSLRPRCMTPWRCLWTVVLMAINGASESRWQQLQPSGTAPSPRHWHTAVWRAGTGGMLVFGGWEGYGGRRRGRRNDLHLYVDEEKQWQQLQPSGTAPTPRSSHTAVWRAGTGGMLLFGGRDSSNSDLNDLHLYVDEESRWQQLQPSGAAPSPRSRHSAVWRSETGGMLLFGGSDYSGYLNDLHLYVDEENRWQLLQPTGTAPTPRWAHSAVWRSGTGGMLVFGGYWYGSNGKRYNDLHLYVDEESRWQQLQPSGTAPTPRYGHSAVWHAETGGMLVYGGRGSSGRLNDLHLYLDQEKRWQQLQPTGTAPSVRHGHSAVWRSGTGGMLVFGGDGSGGRLNDLHLYVDEAADPSTSPRTTTRAPTSTTKTSRPRTATTSSTGTTRTVTTSSTATTRTVTTSSTATTRTATTSGTATTRIATTSSTATTRTATMSSTATTRTATTSNTATTRTATTSGTATTRTSTTAPTSAPNTSHAISFAGTGFEVGPVEPLTSTSTAAVSNPSEKLPWMPPNDQNLEDIPEDASAGLLIAVAMLSVLTCLFASLGILCWFRARRRPGQGNTGGEQVEFPNPLAILPALMPSAGVRPVIFAWNSRMTAEWPRGKVQNVAVEETSFETRGCRFDFQQRGQCRHFIWQDGTVQRLDRIHKNVVWWSTQHEHLAWRQFRWVCTPQCHVEGVLHDMKLVESECSRCAICSSTRASEKHWYCEQHQVHVCPACAELPPDPPTLGISASYLLDIFPPLARSSTAMADPNFYEICPHLAHGLTGIGYDKTCPRDGKLHCSMVDALEDKYSGKVTHFVSWCWAYRLEDVVTAVGRWHQKSSQSAEHIFLWMCFFCNNQYRIMDQAVSTGSDDLKDIFEGHLIEAGQMLVLLDKITQPTYVTRAWCIFESYVSIARDIPMTMILPSGAEDFFRETVHSGGISILSSAVRDLDVRNARAGSKKDEDLIKKIILNTIGFDVVNDAVRARLVKEMTAWFEKLLTSQPN